jgi:hypothetical protein
MRFIVLALVCLWSHKSYSADNYDADSDIIYVPIFEQRTPSQTAMLEYADSLSFGEGQRYKEILNRKAQEIVASEVSNYLANNGYGDLRHFYREIRNGKAQENLDTVHSIATYLRTKMEENKRKRYALPVGQVPTFQQNLHSESFNSIYDAWLDSFSDWGSLFIFSRNYAPYPTFQAALDGIAIQEGKTPEEVKDDVREYHPMALEEP